MSETGQASLPGFEPEPPRKPTDRLFFSIFPDPPTAGRIADLAERLRADLQLKAKPLAAERFHVTMNHLDDFAGVPERVVAAATEAGAAAVAGIAPFEVIFDRAASFHGRVQNKPLVLRGSASLAPLTAFQKSLGVAMTKSGLGKYVERSFTPHVTLLYDATLAPETPVEPIRWSVRELVLVHSLLGLSKHIRLASWPLTG
jgi:2'-5' RNA ligase